MPPRTSLFTQRSADVISRNTPIVILLTTLCSFMATTATAMSIEDLSTWTEVEDPAHPGMSSSVDSANQISLSATGAIPAGTDIGYQSVDGNTVGGSTAGHYFSPHEDFHVAINFDVSALNSVGLAGIGFGIGEDSDGMNSAGVGLAIRNGGAFSFAGAARVNDVNQAPQLLGAPATLSGRFFVQFDSATGDINYGVSSTQGSNTPDDSGMFAALQQSWHGDPLLVSFFLRSDSVSILQPLGAGDLDAVFSNFEVLGGTPIAAVPVPAALYLFVAGIAGLFAAGRRRAG